MTAPSYQRDHVLLDSNDTQQFSLTGRIILHRLTSEDARGCAQMDNAIKTIASNNLVPKGIDQRNFACVLPFIPRSNQRRTRRRFMSSEVTAREEGLRLDEIGMLAGLGWANAQVSRAYGLQRIIPLEELATGTSILDMRALPQIKLVIKFPCACRAAHVVIPFCCCVPLLAHGCLIIRNPSSKRSQNICIICLDIGMRFL
jgi:hypothetical protein